MISSVNKTKTKTTTKNPKKQTDIRELLTTQYFPKSCRVNTVLECIHISQIWSCSFIWLFPIITWSVEKYIFLYIKHLKINLGSKQHFAWITWSMTWQNNNWAWENTVLSWNCDLSCYCSLWIKTMDKSSRLW